MTQMNPMDYARGGTFGYQRDTDARALAPFFNAVYAWMAVGLAVTAVVAWAVAHSGALSQLAFSGPILCLAFIVEMVLVFTISGAVNRINASTATALFTLYSAINGFVLASLFWRYSTSSLAGCFVVTSVTFAVTSIYGYLTQRDLTRLGSLLFMALIGLVIASVVNIFFASSMLYWLVTYAGVLIFVGLTAYDTQKLKLIALQTQNNSAMSARMAVVGSLVLYLDFINLFLLLLRLLDNGRRN